MSDDPKPAPPPDQVVCFSARQINHALIDYAMKHDLISAGVYTVTLTVVTDDPLVLKQYLWKKEEPKSEPVLKQLRWYWPW